MWVRVLAVFAATGALAARLSPPAGAGGHGLGEAPSLLGASVRAMGASCARHLGGRVGASWTTARTLMLPVQRGEATRH